MKSASIHLAHPESAQFWRGTEPRAKAYGLRVLLIEDDPVLAQAVAGYLRAKSYHVDVVVSMAEARAALAAESYGAILLDLYLPDGDGLDLLTELGKAQTRPGVIIVTARDRVSDRIRGLDAGADDYLVKPYHPGELMARLRAIARRRGTRAAAVIRLQPLEIDLVTEQLRNQGVPVQLTAKEWALLRVLATGLDRIHTRESLLKALYGRHDETDSNTLEVFVSRLRRKLGPNHIQTVRGVGYRLASVKVPE